MGQFWSDVKEAGKRFVSSTPVFFKKVQTVCASGAGLCVGIIAVPNVSETLKHVCENGIVTLTIGALIAQFACGNNNAPTSTK